MPDLFTHTLVGYILLWSKRKKVFIPSVFFVGCIFPDLVRGPLLLLTSLTTIGLHQFLWLQILHSPIPLLIQAWLFAFLFDQKVRKYVFLNFVSGIALHLVLDAGQRVYHLSYYWLFPFSFSNPIPGLWWPDNDWITLIAISVAIIVFMLRRDFRKIK